MNIEPLGQRILVEDVIEKYEGKLELPPTSKEKPTFTGKVVAISKEISAKNIAIGDTIYRGEWIGQIIESKNDNLGRLTYQTRVMNIADVLGKVKAE